MLKKILYILITIFFITNSVNAEQWLYIRTPKYAYAQIDTDSILLDGNTVFFTLKKDDYTNNGIFVHKMAYNYKTDKIAVIETTKYAGWRESENIVDSQKFDNPEYKPVVKGTISDSIKTLLGSKKNITHLKKYIQTQEIKFNSKLGGINNKNSNTDMLIWLDGDGKVQSYEFIFGNYPNTLNNEVISEENYLTKYFFRIENGNPHQFHYQKCSIDLENKSGNCTMNSDVTNPALFIRPYIVKGLYPKSAYYSYLPENLGTIRSTDFYSKCYNILTDKNLSEFEKNLQIHVFAQELVNYNKEFYTKLDDKDIKLDKISPTYQGRIGFVVRIK